LILKSSNHRWLVVVKLLLVFGLFWGLAWVRLDPDFGWHLQAGNYIRQHGIPSHDLFTYSAAGFHWIDHEWGNDALVSWLYGLGGYGLLMSVFAGLWTATLWVVGRRVGWPVLLAAAVALLPYAGVRPTIWSLLGLASLLQLTASRSRRALVAIPLLFIIWANLHGGFVIGLAYLAYLAIRQRSRFWLGLLALSAAATLINPYAWQLYSEIGRTLFDRSLHNQINEWRPLFILPPSWAYCVLFLSGFWLLARRKLANWLSFSMLLLAATLAASRNLPLFVIASLSETDQRFQKMRSLIPKQLEFPKKLVLGLLIGLVSFELVYGLYVSYWPWQPRDANYPKTAVAYLQVHSCPGHLFNDYNYGGYLIWQLPQTKVFIDGRMPSWRGARGQKYLDIYYKILDDSHYRQAAFAQYNIRCVLIGNGRKPSLIADLTSHGWHLITTANSSTLLIKP